MYYLNMNAEKHKSLLINMKIILAIKKEPAILGGMKGRE